MFGPSDNVRCIEVKQTAWFARFANTNEAISGFGYGRCLFYSESNDPLVVNEFNAGPGRKPVATPNGHWNHDLSFAGQGG